MFTIYYTIFLVKYIVISRKISMRRHSYLIYVTLLLMTRTAGVIGSEDGLPGT
jgi:hypothetical protein